MANPNLQEDQDENNAELYARLMPYLLRDFMHRSDLKNILLLSLSPEIIPYVDFDGNFEGIRVATLYKELLDSGEDSLSKKIKPIINL